MWEFLTERNTLATNKASGLPARNTSSLRKASALLQGGETSKYEAWFLIFDDFVSSGIKSAQAYGKSLSNNPNVTTVIGAKQAEEMMSAIRRAVAKYGSVAKAKTAHAKWCKENNYHYADTSNFKKFAPDGQRAKSADKKPAPATAVTLTRAEASKRLATLPKAMRDEVIAMLGIK